MRIIVTGCRNWQAGGMVAEELHRLWWGTNGVTVVHGGAQGADRCASVWCKAKGLSVCEIVFRADWKKHGKAAGPLRNQEMVDAGGDLLLAFWDGVSRGTLDCLTRAVKAGIPVRIIPKGK